MISVLLVDDQSLLRMGFRMILEAEDDIEVVGEAADGEAGVAMAAATGPDVVLMDVRMATRRLLDRFAPMLPSTAAPEPGRDVLGDLTDREREVFALVAGGRSNREIAADLHLSEGTVKIHVGRVLAKLDLRDRAAAIVYAFDRGLVTPSGGTAAG